MKTNGKRQKVLYFKVMLSDEQGKVRGRPYRIIAAPGALSLHNLAQVIVESFNLKFDGPFGYYSRIRAWSKSELIYESRRSGGMPRGAPSIKKMKAQELFQGGQKKMLFLFNSNIYFVVQLQRVDEYPRIVAWKGDAPPYTPPYKGGLE